jgi:hypothetical protein
VRYLLHGHGLGGEFCSDGVSLTLPGSAHSVARVRMRLIGANKDSALEGAGVLQGHTNYLMGNDSAHWLRGLPNYAQVRYTGIYAGTDLTFYGNGDKLEHDFELDAGADPSRIAFQLDGAKK